MIQKKFPENSPKKLAGKNSLEIVFKLNTNNNTNKRQKIAQTEKFAGENFPRV